MRRLIRRAVPVAFHRVFHVLTRVHGFGDFADFSGAIGGHFQVVLREVESYAQQRASQTVFIVRVERQIVGARGVAAGFAANRHAAEIVADRRLLPLFPPFRRSRWNRAITDRCATDGRHADTAAAEEAETGVVKVIVVEVINTHADRAYTDERVEVLVIEEQLHAVGGLVRIVTAGGAGAADRVVRFTDTGEQHQADVFEGERGDYHQVGRLFPLVAGRVDIHHAGDQFTVWRFNHAHHFTTGARFEILLADKRRQNRGDGAGFGVVGAAVVGAETTIGAWPHLDAKRVGVGFRDQRGGHREGFVTHVAGGFGKQCRAVGHVHRFGRVLNRAHTLVRVAAFMMFAVDVAGFTGNPGQTLKRGVMRFHLFPVGAPVLQNQLFRNGFRAVLFGQVAFQAELVWLEAEGDARPVVARAAGAVTGVERSPFAHRQCGLRRVVTDGDGVLRGLHHQFLTAVVTQFISHRGDVKITGGIAPWATFNRHHVQAFVGQFIGDDGSGPAESK